MGLDADEAFDEFVGLLLGDAAVDGVAGKGRRGKGKSRGDDRELHFELD